MSSQLLIAAVHVVGVLVVVHSLDPRVGPSAPVAALAWIRRAVRAGTGCVFAGLVAVSVVMVMTIPAQVDSDGGRQVDPPGVDPGTSGPPRTVAPFRGQPDRPAPAKEPEAEPERLPPVTPAQPSTASKQFRLSSGSDSDSGGEGVRCLPKPKFLLCGTW